jgi:hypothetical protein
LTPGCPACIGVTVGEVEDTGVVGWCAGEVGCSAREVGIVVDGLPSFPGFGDGECGGADEEVGAGDEDLDVDEDAPCAPSAPPTHAYLTVKSWSVAADLSSIALSHA